MFKFERSILQQKFFHHNDMIKIILVKSFCNKHAHFNIFCFVSIFNLNNKNCQKLFLNFQAEKYHSAFNLQPSLPAVSLSLPPTLTQLLINFMKYSIPFLVIMSRASKGYKLCSGTIQVNGNIL